MLTFRVEYQDVFGSVHHHDLKENAETLHVTSENRQVSKFCDYINMLLNEESAESKMPLMAKTVRRSATCFVYSVHFALFAAIQTLIFFVQGFDQLLI